MQIVGIIPARYASNRFPGKPLADILGKPMIQRVYEQVQQSDALCGVYVATDDDRIYRAVEAFGGKVMMTAKSHPSGTDRCNEVAQSLLGRGMGVDAVVNIQGDEPFIHPGQIDQVCSCFEDPEVGIATLAKRITSASELVSNSVNKVVINTRNEALYFSRSPIPYLQHVDPEEWVDRFSYYKHIGIYGYRTDILQKITALKTSKLEVAESLEQLRWLDNGFIIKVKETDYESLAIDTPDDLSKITNSA